MLHGTITTGEALRHLAQSRDPAAWAAVLERHGGEIYRLCKRVLFDPALAEDACQETLLLIRDRAAQFHGEGPDLEAVARCWILQIASSVALQILRGRDRVRRREAHAGRGRLQQEEPMADPLEPDERMAALRRALLELPERERQPLVLLYYGQLGYKEIAQTLGCPSGTAKARVHRGLEHLRQRLAALGLCPTLAQISAILGEHPAHASGLDPNLAQLERWNGLLDANVMASFPFPSTRYGGWTIMTKIGLGTVACMALVAVLALTHRANGADAVETKPQPPKKKGEALALPLEGEAGGPAVNGLQLTLSADKTETALMADGSNTVAVTLMLTFTNVSDNPIKLDTYAFTSSHFEAITIKDGDGKLVQQSPPALGNVGISVPHSEVELPTIKPAQSWSTREHQRIIPGRPAKSEPLLFPAPIYMRVGKRQDFAISRPGDYRIQITYVNDAQNHPEQTGCWTGTLTSNELFLRVKPAGVAKPNLLPVDQARVVRIGTKQGFAAKVPPGLVVMADAPANDPQLADAYSRLLADGNQANEFKAGAPLTLVNATPVMLSMYRITIKGLERRDGQLHLDIALSSPDAVRRNVPTQSLVLVPLKLPPGEYRVDVSWPANTEWRRDSKTPTEALPVTYHCEFTVVE